MYRSVKTSTTYSGGSQIALSTILITLLKATDLYNSLPTGNKWHIPSRRVHGCWNCDGDHGVNKCKLPKDQACIQANKKKWGEEKKRKSGSGNSGSNSSTQYERSKFGDRKRDNKPPGGSGVQKFNNVWHMLCNKGCGWNRTHTTGFHAAFTPNPSFFPAALPAAHPYHQNIAKEQNKFLPRPMPGILLSTKHLLVPALLTRRNLWLSVHIMNIW